MLILVVAAACAATAALIGSRFYGLARRNRRHERYLASLDTRVPVGVGASSAFDRADTMRFDAGSDDPRRAEDHGVDPSSRRRISGRPGGGDPAGPQGYTGLPPGAKAFFDWVVVVGVALLVAVGVRTFLLAHFVVDGMSMETTLDPGDRVFVNKLSYRMHEPGRGDVVVLHELSGTAERDLIKRVIALPGEQIEMTNCIVRIDGRVLDEPYLDPAVVTPARCGGDVGVQVVPDDHVFVMGDNRPGSHDSRALGPVPYDDLVGRAFVVFWPQANWHWL
ncbi:MAG: signal peptidase I [Ilumatobacteraceae bacterium]